jgi:SAM-dependent methyltransferase
MRDALRRQVPGVLALAGQAEEVPLPQDSVDAIVAGQSFHWFDGPRALAEFHRVMRPGGRLGLVWNRRDLSQPLHQAIDQIIAPHRGDTPAHDSDHWARAFEGSPLFHPADRLRVPFEQVLDADGFVERVMSISFVAALAGPERESVRARLRALVDSQLAPLRHVTEVFCYVATVSAPSSATPRATSIE